MPIGIGRSLWVQPSLTVRGRKSGLNSLCGWARCYLVGLGDGCHMAKLPSIITAAAFRIKRCLIIPQSQGADLKFITDSFVGLGKEIESKRGLTPSCPHSPAEVRRWVLTAICSFLCVSGHTAMQLKTWTQFSCLAQQFY